ncbi:MAG: cupin domain-containing protein [Paludibacter sp.]|nr:cupin domain-containing protein [Paludibacter sp.]
MKKTSFLIIILFVIFTARAQYKSEINIEPLLKTDTTAIGQKIAYPQVSDAEVTMSRITIPAGKSTGWHKHDYPVFAYVLKGMLTVEIENNKSVQYCENSTISEVIDTYHNGTNKGKEDVVLIAIYLGEKGKDLSTRKE